MPYDQMDLLLYAFTHDIPAEDAGRALGLSEEQVKRVCRDIISKRRTAAQLRQAAILIEEFE